MKENIKEIFEKWWKIKHSKENVDYDRVGNTALAKCFKEMAYDGFVAGYAQEKSKCPKCNSFKTWSSTWRDQKGCDDCGVQWGKDIY